MVTPQDAERLAQAAMQDYVNACKCETGEDVANVLMKLASMCGLGMCAVVGQKDAVHRLLGTADYIRAAQRGVHWNREALQ